MKNYLVCFIPDYYRDRVVSVSVEANSDLEAINLVMADYVVFRFISVEVQ